MTTEDTKKRNGGSVWLMIACLILITAVSAALWLSGQEVAAVLVGVILVCVVTAVAVSWWSAMLLEKGAHIALLAQASDDKRDIQLLKTVTDMGRMWREVQQDIPKLPLLESEGFLPRLEEFSEGEFKEVN